MQQTLRIIKSAFDHLVWMFMVIIPSGYSVITDNMAYYCFLLPEYKRFVRNC